MKSAVREGPREFLDRVDGLFVGQLTNGELRRFECLVERGRARRSYEGAAGFLGLATVRRGAAQKGEELTT